MAFSNTYSEFKSQYELKKTAGLFADALTQFQDAAGQPIFANEEGTPLRNLLNQLDLQPAQQAPPYDFELQNHVTFNQIQAACNQRGVPITGIIRTVSGRPMYDYTYGQPLPNNQEDPNPWREFSRPEAAEKTIEMAQLTFYGDSLTIVDWAETMQNLKALFLARIYTSDMAKTCLMNMVHKYHPDQATMLRQLTANQIATHLLLLDSNRDKKTYLRTQLYKVFRDPEEDLPAALAKAQLLINGVYPDNDPAYTAQRQAAFRTAVLSFCHDTIAAGVLEKIQHHQKFCLPLTDAEIGDYATKFEEHTHFRPTTRLIFGRDINKIPAATFVQLNSNHMSLNSNYPAYPAYPAYANPCANTYPFANVQMLTRQADLPLTNLQQQPTPPQALTPTILEHTPSKSLDFTELPTDSPVFMHNYQTLAQVGNELVLVTNHPDEITPVNRSKHFHTRERMPPDVYQASFNSIIPTEGHVDPHNHYRSYAGDKTPSKPSSQQDYHSNSQPRADSRSKLRFPSNDRNEYQTRYPSDSRTPSSNRSNSQNHYANQDSSSPNRSGSQNRYNTLRNKAYRSQSPALYRSKSPSYTAENRLSRTPYKNANGSPDRDRSSSMRKVYNLMQNGINCRSTYDPRSMKNCTKCMKNDHHEFECSRYFYFADNKCSSCCGMNHRPQDCKEYEDFPPKIHQKN